MLIDGKREMGDFDGEAIVTNGAIAAPLNVFAGAAGTALKGALAPAKGTVKAAQKKAGKAVKARGGTKRELKTEKSAAKKDTRAAVAKTKAKVQAGAQAVSGTLNGSGRKNVKDKLNNNNND